MNKFYFFNLYDIILTELRLKFHNFIIENKDHRVGIDKKGKLLFTSAVFRIKADYKYVSLKFVFSVEETKTFRITIGFGDNFSNYKFSLFDYLAFRNLKFNKKLLFRHLAEYEDSIEMCKNAFEELILLIESEEMKKILNTDFKPDIPRHYSHL